MRLARTQAVRRSTAGRVSLQLRERVDCHPALIPARCGPELEVQATAGRTAGLTDLTDRLAGGHALAAYNGGGRQHVHVRLAGPVVGRDDGVVAGSGLRSRDGHDSAARRHERRAAGRDDVLSSVAAAAAKAVISVRLTPEPIRPNNPVPPLRIEWLEADSAVSTAEHTRRADDFLPVVGPSA